MMVKKTLLGVCILLVIFCLLLTALSLRILVNISDSLPGWVYVYKLDAPVEYGDLVVFRHEQFPLLLLKQVVGSAGDKVSIIGDTVLINDTTVGVLQRTTSKGEVLVPINSQIIPSDQWFVIGSHPRSHDCRYASFGLIPAKDFVGKAWRVF